MDEKVLMEHRALWVPEPTPATGEFNYLLPEERAVVTRLAELGDVRLEQERLTWPRCVEHLRRAAAPAEAFRWHDGVEVPPLRR